MNVGIVVADFHAELAERMLEDAETRADELDVEVVEVLHVHGAFDVPLPAKRLLERDDVDAVVAVGAVVEGDTDHDEMIFQATARTLQELAVDHGKPVALGITGPGMTWDQAADRVHYAGNAVEACLQAFDASGGDTG